MAVRSIRVKVGERWYTVEVEDLSTSPVKVTVEGEAFYVEVEGLSAQRPPPRSGARRTARSRPEASRSRPRTTGAQDNVIRSPMPARVIGVTVRPGDSVSSGQEGCVLEATKTAL